MRTHSLAARLLFIMFAAVLAACSPSGDTPGQSGRKGSAAATMELPSFVSLVKKEGASVVNISATRAARQGDMQLPVPPDDPLAEFFRRFMPPGEPEDYGGDGMGSGFIISADGYILTNAHVVADTDELTVKLTNKKEYKAKLIGADERTDVAVIKIDAQGLVPVPIGDPEKLEVGEWVAAIGAPFGFENSVTAGIVSAKGRVLPDESYVPFIQTDVAVNPGNSGGPLFNMRGEVVGINSMIYSQTGGFMGVSFAIPIDIAMEVAQQLRSTGKVTRGRVGVQAQEVTVDLASSFGLKEASGALVAAVEKGGPADKAGITPGDVILKFGGKAVQDSADLARMVAGTKPGTVVDVDLWRKGKAETTKVTIAELAPDRTSAAPEQREPEPTNRAGLALAELPARQLERLRIDHGLAVRAVSGPAVRAGLQEGDVVLAINNVPTVTVAAFEQQLARAGATVALLIKRGPDTLYLPLKLGRG